MTHDSTRLQKKLSILNQKTETFRKQIVTMKAEHSANENELQCLCAVKNETERLVESKSQYVEMLRSWVQEADRKKAELDRRKTALRDDRTVDP